MTDSAPSSAAASGGSDAADAASPPRLLIAIPCLNEEAHLGGLLRGLLADPFAARAVIAVVDGGSRDASVEIATRAGEADGRVRLLHNPKRIQSAAVNLAAAQLGADADYLVRVDAHAGYPSDFLSRLVRACEETGADTVTVSMRAHAHADSCFQIAAACAQNSVLGTGGSAHRAEGARRWIDHGHHALFTIAAFRDAGGYDESYSHNEDAELDARLGDRGGKILLAGDVVIDYYPRASARALARQYFLFGRGRARMLIERRKTPKLRQLAPAAILPAVLFAALAPVSPPLSLLALAPAVLWLGGCLAAGVALGLRERRACALAAGAPAAIMHLAWSTGFWAYLATHLFARRSDGTRRSA